MTKDFRQLADRLAAIPDIAERARARQDAISALRDFQQQLKAGRQDDVRKLRDDGKSWGELAAILGVTRARVQQIYAGDSKNWDTRQRRASEGTAPDGPH